MDRQYIHLLLTGLIVYAITAVFVVSYLTSPNYAETIIESTYVYPIIQKQDRIDG